jgi:preprotein translocase subunit SecD
MQECLERFAGLIGFLAVIGLMYLYARHAMPGWIP